MKKIGFSFLFLVYFFVSSAQVLPVYHKKHNQVLKSVDFSEFVKKGAPFSLIKVLDTTSVPSATTIFLLNKNGTFEKELLFDTAAYIGNAELIIAGENKEGISRLGVLDIKGGVVIPVQYSKIKYSTKYFATKKNDSLWVMFDMKGNSKFEFHAVDVFFTSYGECLLKNENGIGILDFDGTYKLPCKYESIQQLSIDSFLLKEASYWNYIDRNKVSKFNWRADSIIAVNDSLFLLYSNDFVYIKDSLRNTVGAVKGYDAVEKMNNFHLKTFSKGYFGLVNLQGFSVLPNKFYKIEKNNSYWNVLADEVKALRFKDVVNKNKKRWGVYDTLGNKVLTNNYKFIGTYKEGLLVIQNEQGLWGFADEKGGLQIKPKYEQVNDFINGYALVKQGRKFLLIDKNENIIFRNEEAQLFYYGVIRYRACNDSIRYEGEPMYELHYGVPPYRYSSYALSDFGYIRVLNGPYKGVLHPDGREVVQAYQDTIYAASSDTFFLYKRNNGFIGYSDKYGNTSLYMTDKFEQVQPLIESYSKFRKDGLYGFIDAYGNVHIAPKYIQCKDFSDGMAAIYLKNKWGFIDKDENLLVQPYYKEVQGFRNGFAPVKNINNKWLFINKNGKPINSTLYDDFKEVKNGKYIVRKGNRVGITHSNGKEILPPKYESVEEIGDGLIKVKKDGKYGVMDFEENIVLYYQYDDVKYNPYTGGFFVKKNGLLLPFKLPASVK